MLWVRNKKIWVTYSLTIVLYVSLGFNEDFIRKCDKYQNRGASSLKEQITLYDQWYMGPDAPKPVFRLSGKARLEPVSLATETS